MADFPGDDPWIAKSGIDPKLLHALGVINVVWNACENGLLPLFCLAADLPLQPTLLIIHDLGDVSICNKIRGLLPLRPSIPATDKQMILSALDAYDVNRLNRNQLTHFTPRSEGEALAFYRKKGPEFMKDSFPSDLETVRRVAGEITNLMGYLSALTHYLLEKNQGREPGPLPGILRAPERLWKPPPPDPQGRKRQPQSFP